HTYDFADHGAIMMAARNDAPTNVLQYSRNMGQSWTACQFTTLNQLDVADVQADPDSVAELMLIIGYDDASKRGYTGASEQLCFCCCCCCDLGAWHASVCVCVCVCVCVLLSID